MSNEFITRTEAKHTEKTHTTRKKFIDDELAFVLEKMFCVRRAFGLVVNSFCCPLCEHREVCL